jgi:hypothetical protein
MYVLEMSESSNLNSKKSKTFSVLIFALSISMLTACGSSDSQNTLSTEFASLDYSTHAGECGLTQLYDADRYSPMRFTGSSLDSTPDFDLIDKYPDILEYDDSFDSWADYYSSESAPYEQEIADAKKCKIWLDSVVTTAPEDTEFPNAWAVVGEEITSIKNVVEERVQLFDEMYKLLPFKASDKKQRDKFYGIVNNYEKGRRLAYEGHLAIRQILESDKLNDLDYWLASCPTYIQITDLYGNNVVSSENGLLKIWNNTEEEKTFSGTLRINNGDGVEVASQLIDVTLPAGKSFDQTLEAVEGNDNYTGLPYPAFCSITNP